MKLNIYKSEKMKFNMFKKIFLIGFILLNLFSLVFANSPINEQESNKFFSATDTLFNYLSIFSGIAMFVVMVWSGLKYAWGSSLEKRQEAKRMFIMAIIGFLLFIVLPLFLDLPFAINDAISVELFS